MFAIFSSIEGSAEEMIKQELQVVAEGVATSVLHSSVLSDHNLSIHGRSESASTGERNDKDQIVQGERQYRDKFEVFSLSIAAAYICMPVKLFCVFLYWLFNISVSYIIQEIKTKFPVRENFGYPVSDDIGRLQV